MRKTLAIMFMSASWLVLGGCEQQSQDSLPEPAEGLPQNEAPRTEPDVQIGRTDDVDPGEPADVGSPGGVAPDSPASETPPAGGGADIGGANESPATEPPAN